MRTKSLILTGCLAFAWLGANAQQLREGDVAWGGGSPEFGSVLQHWAPGGQVTEDDNFFISRVKPKARFRNAATQVRDTLSVTYDKRLAAWLPFNSARESGFNRNALPDGLFDSEVFSMWSYVTHWGDWTASLGRVPAALLDVAHKNGVAVSGLASVPYGGLSSTWADNFLTMVNQGADKAAQYLRYYGIDGLGYNSEWSETSVSVAEKIIPFHVDLVKEMRKTNPLFENLWYGGTTDDGTLSFTDRLGPEFRNTFGSKDAVASSLFLNYNWNYSTKVTVSQNLAKTLGRDPLDLYAGFNMQGANPTSWPSLSKIRYSIGLWGAHDANMFFETRHEKGSDPATKQATYLKRTERWFTGGTRNPLNCPNFVESCNYNADNFSFHGMASMMSARSALSWDLSEEPFITYFNLGNGTFFNWKGVQQHNRQWYNIGVQDYLPTWRYWFANTLLAHDPAAVPASGLDADFTWDEAYVGGSTLRIFGSTPEEYLHLFKTQFALQEGDVITFRYKLMAGSGQANLVLTAEGAENTPVSEGDFAVLTTDQTADVEDWITKEFTVGGELAGKTLALVALHFQNTNALNLVLGEFSIVRGTSPVPATPFITSVKVLASHKQGVDGKLIFNMPNAKAAGEPCYNLDVNTAFFKLYAQQEGKEPVFMGMTTSWAGLIFSAPVDFANGTANQVRFGVSAVALDHKSESEIAWSDYMNSGAYTFSDDIQVSKSVITQDEPFVLSYVDPNHEAGLWRLLDEGGNTVFEGMGTSVTVEGLSEIGSYTLQVIGVTHSGSSTSSGTREYSKYVSVTDAKFGRLPEIYTLTANEKDADIEVATDETVNLAYTGRYADGGSSQGVQMSEKHFGVNAGQVGLDGNKAYSIAFWMKVNKVNGYTQFLAIADKTGGWPLTDWGTVWSGFNDKGVVEFTFRDSPQAEGPAASYYAYPENTLPIGQWFHCAIIADIKNNALKVSLYINGERKTPNNIRINGVSNKPDDYYTHTGYDMKASDMIAMGGSASGRAAIDGIIDNFQVWKKAMTEEEVLQSMGDLDPNNLPAGLSYFWNLEEQAASDYGFPSIGSEASVKCGTYELIKLEGEGRAQPHFVEPVYTAGSPQLAGTAYSVVTQPEWKAVKGVLTDVEGNGEAGSAKVTYAKSGDYTVTLTLANPLGSDSRTFSIIKVTGEEETGINGVNGGELRTYTVGDVAYIEFAEAGNYDVRVYDLAGRTVASKAAAVGAGGKMRLHLGPVGTYVVSVQKDGRTLRSVKLLRK